MYFFDLLATTAAETANNEINFESFIFQAENLEKTKKILDIKKGCKIETSGWFGKTETEVNINSVPKDVYLALYDYLVDKGIITKSVESASFFTLESVYRVNKSLIVNFKKFKNSLPMNDHPTILNCYTINYKNLHTFLNSYKHTITPVDIVVGGKRRNKTNCSKNRKNKKTKRKL